MPIAPEKHINRKITIAFFLLLTVAGIAFAINYSGVIHYLQESEKEDPLGKRLMALNEIMFNLQETDGAARTFRITGRKTDLHCYQQMKDSLIRSLSKLEQLFSDTSYLPHIDTLETLLKKKDAQNEAIFELSYINRYRQRYGQVIPLLPDSINYQISQITWSSIEVDSVAGPDSPAEEKSFFGRIAGFLTGSKEEPPTPEKSPDISQVVDSSRITRTYKEPVLQKVKKQLQKIDEQDKRFARILAQREQSLILLETRLTNTIRIFVKKLEEQAISDFLEHQEELEELKADLFKKIVLLGVSALLIFLSFIAWIGHDLRKSQKMREELISSREKIKSLMKVKEKFLANMSHEIRTPLTAIIGFSEIMKEDSNSAAIIHNSALHLLSLVNDILDYSALQEGRLTLQKENINGEKLIREVYQTFEAKTRQKKLDFSFFNNSGNLQFQGDKTRLKQILFNLTGNAIKFTNNGRVWLGLKLSNQQLIFEVGDTGTGISEEQSKTVFDEFTQLDSTTSFTKGTGLGLAISEKLVQSMGGQIGVTSKPGKGSLFWFTIPYIPAGGLHQDTEDSGNKYLYGGKILIVDDDPMVEQLIRKFIGNSSEIKGYNSAEKALIHLRTEAPALIITDFRMPGMNGVEFIRKIRESHKTPVLLLSAAVNENQNLENIHQIDNVYIMPKPFSRNDLVRKIEAAQKNKVDYPSPVTFRRKQRESLFDLSGITSFTGEDKEFLTSVTNTFIKDTRNNIKKLSKLISRRKHRNISDQAHKMQTGFRQFGIHKGSTILKGIEILGRSPGSTPELKRGLKRLKNHWSEVEKELKNSIINP